MYTLQYFFQTDKRFEMLIKSYILITPHFI